MAGFTTAGIRLAAVGVTSFQQSMTIAHNAQQQFSAGLARSNASKLNNDIKDITVSAAAAAVGIGLMTTALADFIATTSGFASVKFAAEVERDAKFMQAVLQATDADMKKLLGTAESLGANVPTAFREIIAQLRELGRAGIEIDSITASVGKLSASVAILAKGEASPQKVAEGLSAISAAFSKPGDDIERRTELIERAGKAIIGVANATRLSIPEVFNAFTKAAPTGAIFGVSIEQLGAFVALIGAAGIRGEEAGTGIRNFFLRMANPSAEAAEQMQKFNLSFFDIEGNARPVVDVISDLVKVYGDEAIALGKITPAQRAYSLSQIFQTRTAAISALAIIQTDEAYNHYLQVIAETDPILQAAQATDNLLDRLDILKNRVQILGNTFGAAVLPGIRAFADNILDILGDVSQPTNRARQAAGAAGQGVAGLFTGQGIGEAASELESQFGSQIANMFETIAEQAAIVRDVIANSLIPAIGEFFAALGRLSVDTVFNPNAVRSFSGAIVDVIGFTTGLIRSFALMLDVINSLKPVAAAVFGFIGTIVGAVSSYIGSLVSGTVSLMDTAATALRGMAKELEFFKQFENSTNPALRALAGFSSVLDRTGQVFQVFTGDAKQIGAGFSAVSDRVNEANQKLQQLAQNERNIRVVADATRVWETELKRLQQLQLADEGPDVSEEINAVQLTINALREHMRVMAGTESATDAVAAAQARLKEAYDAWQASAAKTEGQFDNLAEQGRKLAQQEKEIATATVRLSEIYDDLGRSAARAVREVGDRVEDLVNKTNTALRKLSEDTQDRIDDIRSNLALANADAKEAFDFETVVRQQRLGVTQMFEDINKAVTRSFDVQRRALSDSTEDRERGRQREIQLVQDSLQRQVDENVRANSEINEDYQQALSRRNEDLQRALSRAHQLQTEQLQETFNTENERRSRANEDNQRQRDLARELAKAKTEEERRSIRERFAEETTTIGERRALETSENNIRKQQEEQLKQLRIRQENETLSVTRSLAKQELDIRRQLATEERAFRLQQEFALAAARLQIEEQVIRETRRLRDTVDLPASQRLEDRQTGAQRQIGVGQQGFEDFFRQQQLERDAALRLRGATRQEEEVLRSEAKRQTEILQSLDDDLVRVMREFLEKVGDQNEQASNTAADILKRIGTDFPVLAQFRANLGNIFGPAGTAGQAAINGARGGLVVPGLTQPSIGQGAGGQIPPEIIQLALIPATALSARFGDLSLALVNLTTAINNKAQIGGVNVAIDDINLGNSIVVGEGSLGRLGTLLGGAAARAIASVGGI